VSALVESQAGSPRLIEGLAIQHVAGRVDEQSRALHFYVTLPNKLLRETTSGDGRKFVYWQYLPGQRMQIRVPIEKWEERIVLPVDAVAHDGVETYVFQPNGDHFDRIPVHLEYRDQVFAVIANDGSIFPGDTVAGSAAHQMQMALKNESGGAIDAHSGHSH
jgi:membrane fusion protein, heavy metal efflux system